MRILVIFAIITYMHVITAGDNIQNGPFADYIISTMECIRYQMTEGIPEQGIPHFNPLLLEKLSINLDSSGIEGVSGLLRLENVELSGPTQWETTKLIGRISLFPPSYNLNVGINFPKLIFRTSYSGNITVIPINDNNIYGNGTLEFEDENLAIDIHATVKIWGGISLTHLNLRFSTDPLASFNVTGLFGDERYSALLSEYIFTNGVNIVEQYSSIVSKIVRNILVNNHIQSNISNTSTATDTTIKGTKFDVLKYIVNKCRT